MTVSCLSFYYYCCYFCYYYFDGKRTTISQQGNWERFFFYQMLALNNHSRKITAGECNVNTWQGQLLPFLGLINRAMSNQYVPHYSKSRKDKSAHSECLALGGASICLLKLDCCQGHPQNSQTNSRAIFSGFHVAFPIPYTTQVLTV